MSEEAKGSHAEADKLRYDFFKHLTTLSTGSILLSAALLEKLFTKPNGKILVLFALTAFVICILGSLIGMFYKAYQLQVGSTLEVHDRSVASIATFIAMLSFLLGIIFLVVFVGINL
jgi:hypothetical protein